MSRYARIYHDLRATQPTVYADDDLLATWLRLYLTADSVWPDVAECPRIVEAGPYHRLADLGTIAVDPDDEWQYRIPALDEDRVAYSERARKNVHGRHKTEPGPSETAASLRRFYSRRTTEGQPDNGRPTTYGTAQTDVTYEPAAPNGARPTPSGPPSNGTSGDGPTPSKDEIAAKWGTH